MADFLPPSVAFLLGNIDDFKAKMGEAVEVSEKTDSKISKAGELGKKAFLGVAAAVGATAIEALKLSSTFDATMARINTQDGVGLTVQQMKALKASVLDLAGPTAQAPEALADAMVHVEGSGLRGAKALDLLKVAAQGASVGNANLVDVTNALDAAVAVGIKGTGDYQQAMGELNATVGAGDMTMQNLADALGGPMLATVKGYGLSITDVGAGLAVFGDRNIRGAEAATELRMAVQALAVPAASGADALAKIGLRTDTLRKDMEEGGLNQALNDLNNHLLAAGYNSTTAGSLITQAFGKKAGGGLNILMDSLASSTSNFNDKFEEVAKSGKTFAADWAQTQDTLAFKMKSLGSAAEAELIRFGEVLTPTVGRFAGLVEHDAIPALDRFAHSIGDALNSPAAHAAGQELLAVWHDVVGAFANGAAAARNLAAALAPAAQFLAGAFLFGLRAAGAVLSVVAAGVRALSGFLRDHADAIKLVAEVVLPVLIARLVYLKTLVAIDWFIGFVGSVGRAAEAMAAFGRSVVSGTVFSTLQTKAAAAAEAVRGLATTTEAATAAQTAATTAAAAAEARQTLETALSAAAAKAKVGSLELLTAATTSEATAATAAAAAEEAMTAKTSLLAAAAGISAKQVTALAEASTASAAASAEASAAAEASAGSRGFGALAGSLGGTLGVMGAVITGAAMLGNYLGHLAGVGDHTALNIDAITNSLLDMSQGSTTATAHLEEATLAMATATQKMGNDAVQGMKDIDGSLAQLVSSGHADQAIADFTRLQKYLEIQGYSIGYQNEHLFPTYIKALADAGIQARLTGTQVSSSAADFGPLLTGALTGARRAAEDLSAQLDAVDESYQTLSGHLSEQGILDNFKKDLLSVKDAVQQNGASFDDNTLKGLANRDAYRQALQQIIQYRDETVKNGTVLPAEADKIAAAQISDLQKTWVQAGANKKQIDDYSTSLGIIPKSIATTITLQTLGLNQVMQGLQQVLNLENSLGQHTNGGRTTIPMMAVGGEVVGAGTSTSDSNLRLLSNREWVISAAGASQFPREFLNAVNRGDVNTARGVLGGDLTSSASFGGGISTPMVAGGGDVGVTVYVQTPGQPGYKQAREVRKEINRYQGRNSRNGLVVSGIAG